MSYECQTDKTFSGLNKATTIYRPTANYTYAGHYAAQQSVAINKTRARAFVLIHPRTHKTLKQM